ncbi:MAG TPA: glycoside hydrolase, partial [Firmicutes bacterium]|nr:glycoside hydrolase [Bacillota bacterium]
MTLFIAFVWNQHQPFYLDTGKKEFIMPWVRLHAAKDYYQMAAILRSHPEIRQTFNITPSLLQQLEAYRAGAEDYYLKVMKPAAELNLAEKRFLLQHYFDIHWERVIALWPRYRQL